MLRSRVMAFALLLVVLAACSQAEVRGGTVRITTRERVVTMKVEVAVNDEAKSRGLSGRAALPQDEGMVFPYDTPVQVRFWMKDVRFPLSIAFWDAGGRIIHIVDMPLCTNDPCPTYGPSAPFVGALEVNEGFFERNGVRVGDRITLDG